MTKPFYEVFPTVRLNERTRDLFGEVLVNRIAATRNKSRIHVYIESPNLISNEALRDVEHKLSGQLFPHAGVTFFLHETFHLSSQYTPENLLEVYKESLESEMRERSPLLYHLYRHSKLSFTDEGDVLLVVPDDLVSRGEAEELADFLSQVLKIRCGLSCSVTVRYEKQEAAPEKRKAEERILRTLDSIIGNLDENNNTEEESTAPGEKEKEEAPAAAVPQHEKNVKKSRSASSDPDVIFGRDIKDDEKHPVTPMRDIIGDMTELVVRGQLFFYEETPLRSGRYIVSMDVTDYTDSIRVKIFMDAEHLEEFRERLQPDSRPFIKVKGITNMDTFERDIVLSNVKGIRKIPSFVSPRTDNAPEKRVELHMHTKMSELDAVSGAKELISQAKSWGMKAIAVTDHGNVQAFPEAYHCTEGDKDFKVIYGLEGYLVDDQGKSISVTGQPGEKNPKLSDAFVVFDLETTGLSPVKHKIIEIGAVRIEGGVITERFNEFVNPEVPIPFRIQNLTGIRDKMVQDADLISEVLPRFLEFSKGAVMVAHNASFDISFVKHNAKELGLPFDKMVLDTLELSRTLLTDLNRHTLDRVAEALGVSLENHHRAVDDAAATGEIFIKLSEILRKRGIFDFDGIASLRSDRALTAKRLRSHHVIILAKNETGRINLYRLVSESHLKYFHKRPRIPKSLLTEFREGLIIGSACASGELFEELVRGADEDELARIAGFYDYLEIQPVGNNLFLLDDEKNEVHNEEDLRELNVRICELGERMGKPVCATGDVHFMNPEDEIYRRIIFSCLERPKADEQPPLYLRTTEEMLEEFSYLGEERAYRTVVTNTNLIADMIDPIEPVRPDKCPPVIENSDQILRQICYDKAHELYGEELPTPVEERLERELKSIIGNGYAVMYVIAQKLVWKSLEDGYLVGSRGSVGSSFAANMAGITEVNSLPPHYICPNCHYSDFDSTEVKAFAKKGMCGYDMPDRKCPECGTELIKTGYDIPFETFLGFKGDKEPDIDLNFSGDYQAKAHKYTEVIFGAGQTFRAGTVSTIADKIAIGYVNAYFRDHETPRRWAEIRRLGKGCEGVMRTTGQHPGGIVVLPRGEEINTFTPVQHPPKDDNIITTHFEYHSIDRNLLKLDILGHDDPTMIRFLQDATDIKDLSEIRFDDPTVMKLFTDTEPLGITPEDIRGCPTGTLGIPEYGTDFVIQMLVDTQPKTFSDLIRISGLSHGTDVWVDNAQYLVNEMDMELSDCICCRDDIMLYLISMGMDPALSFKIMEGVRKGKGLTEEQKSAMREVEVPEWYIDSCLKIKYMFPKAHAAAYVMMAWRVAWFKIHRPLAYYSGFLSIRAGVLDYATMCQDRARLEQELEPLWERVKENGKNRLTDTEKKQMRDMRIIEEMFARGFEFVPIDLNTVDPKYFRQVDEKHIMPPLSSVAAVGEKAADALVNAIRETKEAGPFLSVDDFRERTGCSKGIAASLKELGLLGDIPESNQLSLFDLV
ncbi:MAG: PolC-type DNA polymerase III [Lachnospiraceae bacterium]|nr:PolC-type DNA polymerase III [Lachnospiraceae bacterium]